MSRMKTMICIAFVLVVLATIVQAEELRWDLLHQTDYDVKPERAELVWYNTSYLRDAKLGFPLYNRTQRVFNGSAHILVNLSSNLTASYQAYKFMSNEYRFFPLTVSFNVCREYERNSFNLKTILQKTSNIPPCPIKKGFYYMGNALPDYSKWPPFIPRGGYKAVINLYHNSDWVQEAHFYGSIKDKPLKWTN